MSARESEASVEASTPESTVLRPAFWATLRRGARKACPHCGMGPLFETWFKMRRDCPSCGLVYLRNPGDIWLFWTFMDRIPIVIGLVLIVFFGLRTQDLLPGLIFLAAMVVPLVATMPHRQGIAVALDFLSRHYFRDASDELPPLDPRLDNERPQPRRNLSRND